jgi:hypothetical protein
LDLTVDTGCLVKRLAPPLEPFEFLFLIVRPSPPRTRFSSALSASFKSDSLVHCLYFERSVARERRGCPPRVGTRALYFGVRPGRFRAARSGLPAGGAGMEARSSAAPGSGSARTLDEAMRGASSNSTDIVVLDSMHGFGEQKEILNLCEDLWLSSVDGCVPIFLDTFMSGPGPVHKIHILASWIQFPLLRRRVPNGLTREYYRN